MHVRRAACLLTLLAAAAGAAGEGKTVKQTPRFGPPKDGKWVPIETLTDEFQGGKLDPAKWHPRNPTWKGRPPGFFHEGNVAVSDGKLHLTMRRQDLPGLPKGYHTYTCAAVKSTLRVRYGYFEVKCRPMDSRGSSAFWFYDGTPETWTEIDVFEMGAGHPKHERTVHMNAHVFHTLTNPGRHWSRGGKWQAPYRLADGYHVYALLWSPDEIRYFVDGACVRTMSNTHWHQPLYLNFDSETMPRWFGLPKVEKLPTTFSIEYVRAWRRADAPAGGRPAACEFRFPGNKARSPRGKRTAFRIPAAGGGKLAVQAQLVGTERPAKVTLEYEDAALFQSQTAARVRKTVEIADKGGRKLRLTFTWSRLKKPAAAGPYQAEGVDIQPAKRPAESKTATYEFVSDEGKTIRVTLRH